jgi:hypothetical protein
MKLNSSKPPSNNDSSPTSRTVDRRSRLRQRAPR